MKKLMVMNLKMNLDYSEAETYVINIKNKISDIHDVIFCPSSPYLSLFQSSGYKIGVQNVFSLNKGAYTGEVSPLQLKSMGINYSIVGHSERRTHFHEHDKLISEKIDGCLANGIIPILCIGESLEEKQLKRTSVVLNSQLSNDLKNVDSDAIVDVVIAYEPVWAIGSGKTPTLSEIEDVISYIKKNIKAKYNTNIKVLYGGSVNKDNIKAIINISNIDGVLVGSASIDSDYLIKMLDLID